MLGLFTKQLQRGDCLTAEEVKQAVEALVAEDLSAEVKAEFLTALAIKGETPEEIGLFASELRDRAIAPPIDSETRQLEIMDVCGTGGDRLNTFNISTTVALVVAAAGVPVAKHGNRAITSQAGSADVLEALGIPIDLSPEQAADSLREQHFAFFFAPKYHPSFKQIAPARRLCADKGQRTVFNVLGPLLNPARPSAQLVGVPGPQFCDLIGRVLQSLGVRRAMVVCGRAGEGWLDELSILGENRVAEFYQDRGFTGGVLAVHGFPIQPSLLADLVGGDRQANAKTIHQLLSGQERGPKLDAVLLNASAALWVAGKTRSLMEGWDLAAGLIQSGAAARKLQQLARS